MGWDGMVRKGRYGTERKEDEEKEEMKLNETSHKREGLQWWTH
jgi:hypothetical protein